MSEDEGELPATQQADALAALWAEAATKVPPKGAPTKAPLFGVNFRVDVLKALQAAWETAEVAVKTGAAIHSGHFDPGVWAGIAIESASAARSVISSLVQQMQPLDYISYVILSKVDFYIDAALFKSSIQQFLEAPHAVKFGWHLGLNKNRIQQAKEKVTDPTWFEDMLDRLENRGMIFQIDSKVHFKSRNFSIGWSSE